MLPIIMVVLDGASDRPGARMTPLEAANTPHLDALVRRGSLGAVYTVGRGIAPESDAGVFSLLGYDPLQTHLSRGVVEAIGAGVRFRDGDLALRAGFATVEGQQLVDRRAGRNLSTEEAVELGAAVNKHLHLKEDVEFEFRPTVGHRAVVVFRSRATRLSSEVSNFDPGYVRDGIISIAQPGKGPYDIPHCEPMDRSEAAIRTAALVNEFGFKTIKTKAAQTSLNHLAGVKGFEKLNYKKGRRALVSLAEADTKMVKSFRNIPGVAVEEARNLNPLSALTYKYLIIPEASLKVLASRHV